MLTNAVEVHSSQTPIADGILRLTLAPSSHFEFSQFLILDEVNCLVHAGKEKLFPQLLSLVGKNLQGRDLDFIVFSHVEADESGAVNRWLEEFPRAQVVCNKIANISLDDFLIRPARILKDGELLKLGKRSLQLINTPHFPHNWDAHMWYEPNEQILFSSDFCCQGGICEPVTENDIASTIIEYYAKNGFMPYGKTTEENLDKLSKLPLKVIAPMHGSVIVGKSSPLIFDKVRADLLSRS